MSQQPKRDSRETTLAKRVLNSNLSDEDKISLIQLLGNQGSVISIPSVWTPNPTPLDPYYRDYGSGSPRPYEFSTTRSTGDIACHQAGAGCSNEE
jgi:hypothetical protein